MRIADRGDVADIITCEGVHKEFTHKRRTSKVVADFQLAVKPNEFVVLFGPGQCGKTTVLNILAGLETPTSGRVTVAGTPVTGPGSERGFVYQTLALFPWLTVEGNVAYGPKVRGVSKREYRECAQRCIDLVGLTGFERSYPNQISGGMKQRVGIARAYCNDPEVLFMDEPFGHLDAQTRYLMQEEIVRIWGAETKTIVFVTNNIEEAVYLADRILVLTECPTKIKAEYKVELGRPRSWTDPEFIALRQQISDVTYRKTDSKGKTIVTTSP